MRDVWGFDEGSLCPAEDHRFDPDPAATRNAGRFDPELGRNEAAARLHSSMFGGGKRQRSAQRRNRGGQRATFYPMEQLWTMSLRPSWVSHLGGTAQAREALQNGSDLLCFVDDDEVVAPDWLEQLVAGLSRQLRRVAGCAASCSRANGVKKPRCSG